MLAPNRTRCTSKRRAYLLTFLRYTEKCIHDDSFYGDKGSLQNLEYARCGLQCGFRHDEVGSSSNCQNWSSLLYVCATNSPSNYIIIIIINIIISYYLVFLIVLLIMSSLHTKSVNNDPQFRQFPWVSNFIASKSLCHPLHNIFFIILARDRNDRVMVLRSTRSVPRESISPIVPFFVLLLSYTDANASNDEREIFNVILKNSAYLCRRSIWHAQKRWHGV